MIPRRLGYQVAEVLGITRLATVERGLVGVGEKLR